MFDHIYVLYNVMLDDKVVMVRIDPVLKNYVFIRISGDDLKIKYDGKKIEMDELFFINDNSICLLSGIRIKVQIVYQSTNKDEFIKYYNDYMIVATV